MQHRSVRIAAMAAAWIAANAAAQAPWKLTPPATSPATAFGHSIAAHGNLMVIGDRHAASSEGRVHVYERSGQGWSHSAILMQPPPRRGSTLFGDSVATDGSRILVGASLAAAKGESDGAAYLYERRGGAWRLAATLSGSFSSAGLSWFGWAVSISGDRAAIGAWADEVAGVRQGAVYIFTRRGGEWELEARLTEPGTDRYGGAVSISGARIAVGAPLDDAGCPGTDCNAGAVYIYKRTGAGWQLEQRLTPETTVAATFGARVLLDGPDLFVGAPADTGLAERSGSVHIFRRTGAQWQRRQVIISSLGGRNGRFGDSMAQRAGWLAIGAPWEEAGGYVEAGAGYIFEQIDGAWIERERITAPDAGRRYALGYSTALTSTGVVLGAPGAYRNGAAYLAPLPAAMGRAGEDGPDLRDIVEFQHLAANNDSRADLDGSGAIDIEDLLLLLDRIDR
ncbi:MAG: hypothetical protein ACF8R7_12375 [Phycisphaerales bacterium JB039]